MAVHTRLRPSRWTLVVGVALTSLGLLSFNAWAAFTAQVTPTHATDTGNMDFTLDAAGASHRIATPSTDLVPGDYVSRTIGITVANEGGTMTGVNFTATGTGTPAFLTTGVAANPAGLGLVMARCPSPGWVEVGGAPPGSTYTCGGTPVNLIGTWNATLGSATFANFLTASTDIAAGMTLTDGAVNSLLVILKFPNSAAAQDSMESESSTLSFDFAGVQRAGANK